MRSNQPRNNENDNLSNIHDIIKKNDIESFKLLLANRTHKINLSEKDKAGKKPIEYVHSFEMLKLITGKYYDLEHKYDFGSLLLDKIAEKDYESSRLLLESGATTDWVRINTENNLLHTAIANNDLRCAELILRYNPKLLAQENLNKKKPIELASSFEMVQLITKNRPDQNYNYGSLLLDRIAEEDYESSRLLLESGAATTWHYVESKNNLLHVAIENNDLRCAKLILRYNPGLLAQENLNKKKPIELASSFEMIQLITKNRPDQSYNYGALLFRKIAQKDYESSLLLLEAGAATGWTYTDSKNNLLHVAIENNDLRCAELILRYNPELLAQENSDKKKPIELAISFEMIQLITKNRPDQNYNYGALLLDKIVEKNYKSSLLLLESGAITDWVLVNNENNLLHVAIQNNDLNCAELILNFNPELLAKENLNKKKPIELANSPEMIKLITSQYKDSDNRYHYSTLLFDKIKKQDFFTAWSLLEAGASFDWISKEEEAGSLQKNEVLDVVNGMNDYRMKIVFYFLIASFKYTNFFISKYLIQEIFELAKLDFTFEHHKNFNISDHYGTLKTVFHKLNDKKLENQQLEIQKKIEKDNVAYLSRIQQFIIEFSKFTYPGFFKLKNNECALLISSINHLFKSDQSINLKVAGIKGAIKEFILVHEKKTQLDSLFLKYDLVDKRNIGHQLSELETTSNKRTKF